RDVPAFSKTLRRLRFRKPHHHSQQSTVSVFAGEIHSATRLVDLRVLRCDQLVAARSDVHHTLRGPRVFAAWLAANRAQTERALVVRSSISRGMCRARAFSNGVELGR